MLDFYSHDRQEIAAFCQAKSAPLVHAKTLFRAAYKRLENQPWTSASIPLQLGVEGSQSFSTTQSSLASEQVSRYDGTVKFLVRLHDGKEVESVLIPEKSRLTLCVSSQVGCAQGCTFCYTGRMGLVRNLSGGEIVSQVVLVNSWIREHKDWLERLKYPRQQQVTNIVFMGMGEPLDNVPAVTKAVSILTDPYGLAMGLQKIAVSTSGHLDGLDALLLVYPKIPIAVSLHAVADRQRSQIMPINRRWNIEALINAIRRLNTEFKKPVLVQYTVIDGVNDSLEQAAALVNLMQGLDVKINLIPFNEVAPSRFKSPRPERLESFKNYLHHQGIRVLVRYSKGQDISGACGQLVVNE